MFIIIICFLFNYLERFSNLFKVVTENAFVCFLVCWHTFFILRKDLVCYKSLPKIAFILCQFFMRFISNRQFSFAFSCSVWKLSSTFFKQLSRLPSHPHLFFLRYILPSWIIVIEKPYEDLPTFSFHVFLFGC